MDDNVVKILNDTCKEFVDRFNRFEKKYDENTLSTESLKMEFQYHLRGHRRFNKFAGVIGSAIVSFMVWLFK